MKRGGIVLTIIVMFFLFLPFAFSAENDIWRQCTRDLSQQPEPGNIDDTTGQSCCQSGDSDVWEVGGCCPQGSECFGGDEKIYTCDSITSCGTETVLCTSCVFPPATSCPSAENCLTKPLVDSDGSNTLFLVGGTVTDYSGCNQGSCTEVFHNDTCFGDSFILEAGILNNDFITTGLDCRTLGTDTCINNKLTNTWDCLQGLPGQPPGFCQNTGAPILFGADSDGDGVDRECEDASCDNVPGVCDTAVAGKCVVKTSSEVGLCTDGLDNDCDGLTDCADSDCDADLVESCCTIDKIADKTPKNWNSNARIFEDSGIWYGPDLFDSDAGSCPTASCEPGQDCTCFDNTGTRNIKHKSALTTGLCCGNDPGEFYKPDETGGAECVSDKRDCVWSTGDAQKHDSGNEGWWCDTGRWEKCIGPEDVGKQHGSAKCAGAGTGWTLDPDPENTYGPNACTDGLNNDVDFDEFGNPLIDCQDLDCGTSVSGTVRDTGGIPISGAVVRVLQGIVEKHTAVTDNNGVYQLDRLSDEVFCGTYDMIASATDYVSSTETNVEFPPNDENPEDVVLTMDFELVLGTTCEADCTYAEDNTVHKECDQVDTDGDGISDCIFYDETAKQVCNLAQPGWIRDYNNIDTNCPDGNCVIECAEGIPQPKVETKAEVTCELENMLKITKIVTYKGKLVKLNIVICG